MKILQQILFAALIVAGFSLTAAAQRPNEGRKEKPPKENAEIKPEDKKPRNNENNNNNNNNRGNENRGKKPQVYFLTSKNRLVITSQLS